MKARTLLRKLQVYLCCLKRQWWRAEEIAFNLWETDKNECAALLLLISKHMQKVGEFLERADELRRIAWLLTWVVED